MRKVLALTLTLLLTVLAVIPAIGAEPALNTPINCAVVYSQGEASPTRAEEFVWYFRDNNGVIEKRLWSITYMYWVTDWIPA